MRTFPPLFSECPASDRGRYVQAIEGLAGQRCCPEPIRERRMRRATRGGSKAKDNKDKRCSPAVKRCATTEEAAARQRSLGRGRITASQRTIHTRRREFLTSHFSCIVASKPSPHQSQVGSGPSVRQSNYRKHLLHCSPRHFWSKMLMPRPWLPYT